MVRFDFHKHRSNNVAEFVLPRLSAISSRRGLALACLILRLGVVHDIGESPPAMFRRQVKNVGNSTSNCVIDGEAYVTTQGD